MMRQGYGRLLAALVAAGGVHALILLTISDTKMLVNGELSQLKVELVAADSRQQQGAQVDAASAPRPTPKKVAVQPENEMQPFVAEETQQSEQPLTEVAYHADDPAGQGEATSQSADPMLTPPAVQSLILAQVSYPRLARRRGWEGQVHLSFDVSDRVVSGITLLKACEHPALNEAAQEGLRRMRTVALADGRYWLPVEFRLR